MEPGELADIVASEVWKTISKLSETTRNTITADEILMIQNAVKDKAFLVIIKAKAGRT